VSGHKTSVTPLKGKLVCLSGGTGAAKFLQGLIRVVPQEDVVVIANTGDDMDLYGLHVSPDPDIVMYTLSGIADEEKGWGIHDDTYRCLEMLKKYGLEAWFKLGDRDLATHIHRTRLMKDGFSLEQVTQRLCNALGLKVRILPMSNDTVASKIITGAGEMHFEEYLVKREAKDRVLDVVFEGIETARPAPGVVESIEDARAVVLCPSNPIVSIGPILAINGVKESLTRTKAKIAAISPIVNSAAIKGPADKLMKALGMEVSAYSVASLYRDFLDVFILDQTDKKEKEKIERLGIKAVTADTIMRTLEDKTRLAQITLKAAE
jgi:LPPG:FO 2-phospho-L-lactate transferase